MPKPNVIRSKAKKSSPPPPPPSARPPILWTRVLMGFALNVMVVTLGVASLGSLVNGALWVLIGPVVFGVLTAMIVPHRAGVHVFLAGLLSIPFLALFVLSAFVSISLVWPYAILAGGIFAMAGLITDLVLRFLPK